MGGGKRVNRYFESTIISTGELKKWALLLYQANSLDIIWQARFPSGF